MTLVVSCYMGLVGAILPPPDLDAPIVFREALVVGKLGEGGRRPFPTDTVRASMVAGTWSTPHPGESITSTTGEPRTWSALNADENGVFRHEALGGGYAHCRVESDTAKVMILESRGNNMVYVNGVPRVGDRYSTGFVQLPVKLRKGTNEFLFHCSRGSFSAHLIAPQGPLQFNPRDATLPDVIVGETTLLSGAIVVLNNLADKAQHVRIKAGTRGGVQSNGGVTIIPPCSVRKLAFEITLEGVHATDAVEIPIELLTQEGDSFHPPVRSVVKLRVRNAGEVHKRTFVSEIDGSVQYYAVSPASPTTSSDRPALVLSIHGAGVEATGQVQSYHPKTWAHIVAPTNRRPFGFDWEDWGRMDALEVLDLAQRRFRTDPTRTYLTGHSMGGHGTWHLGVTYPDRFAAIGPSAGWISFWSYTGASPVANDDPVGAILRRAVSPSETLELSGNLSDLAVYILHGDADDNVPVEQARNMRDHLATQHNDLHYHEQPGAGHWWGASDEPGVECLDWPQMFDLFARRRIPRVDEVRDIAFTTANPGVSAQYRWVTIEAQSKSLVPAAIKLRYDPGLRRITGTTNNVARLSLDLRRFPAGKALTVQLDGQSLDPIPWPVNDGRFRLARSGETWATMGTVSPALKGPHRYGPFKQVFRNRVMLVYGTTGTDQENAWSFNKARYDAETFWYRGNAAVDVLPDSRFLLAEKDRDRNVVLYGHAQSNSAWARLLADSPVRVNRGSISIGSRRMEGDELGCLMIRPKPGSDVAAVGLVGGTGIQGMRATDRLPYFVSGVAYPDLTVFDTEVTLKGEKGVRAAGFFGVDWSVETGDFAWRGHAPTLPEDPAGD